MKQGYTYVIKGLSKYGEASIIVGKTTDEMIPQLIEVYWGQEGEETIGKIYPVSEPEILEKE